MSADEVIAAMDERFTSGNAIPVERAYIKREEWDAVLLRIESLKSIARSAMGVEHE